MPPSAPHSVRNASFSWYEIHADEQAALYEALDPSVLLADALGSVLCTRTAGTRLRVLDVGSGSGRDAAWLSQQGHAVVAVEPSRAMRRQAEMLHPEAGVAWMDGALPNLGFLALSRPAYDLVLVSAVWQHVAPHERSLSMRALRGLLNPGGALSLLLRHGASPDERCMHDANAEETLNLGASLGLESRPTLAEQDKLGRSGVRWSRVTLHLPRPFPSNSMRPTL